VDLPMRAVRLPPNNGMFEPVQPRIQVLEPLVHLGAQPGDFGFEGVAQALNDLVDLVRFVDERTCNHYAKGKDLRPTLKCCTDRSMLHETRRKRPQMLTTPNSSIMSPPPALANIKD
jgi:hypothetical protein